MGPVFLGASPSARGKASEALLLLLTWPRPSWIAPALCEPVVVEAVCLFCPKLSSILLLFKSSLGLPLPGSLFVNQIFTSKGNILIMPKFLRKIEREPYVFGRPSAKAVMTWKGQVLLLQKPSGKWDLPGGKLDPGETLMEGLAREVREEIGFSVSIGQFLVSIDRSEPGLEKGPWLAFHCPSKKAFRKFDFELSDEHVDYSICHLDEVDGYEMNDLCREALKAVSRIIF